MCVSSESYWWVDYYGNTPRQNISGLCVEPINLTVVCDPCDNLSLFLFIFFFPKICTSFYTFPVLYIPQRVVSRSVLSHFPPPYVVYFLLMCGTLSVYVLLPLPFWLSV